MTTRSLHIGPRIGPRIGVHGDTPPGPPPETTTLTVSIADTADPVISAVNFAYSVIVTNTGGIDALLVVATVTLDATLTFVSGVGTGWLVAALGQVVTCTRATLAVGVAPTITISVTSADAASTETTTADAIASNAAAAPQDSETTVVNLVARDATSLKRIPATLTQWQDWAAYHVLIGTPNFPNVVPANGWKLQEAAAPMIDFIGASNLTMSGVGLLFQQPVVGWSTLAVSTPDGQPNHNAQTTTAVDISTTSALLLAYVRMPAIAPAAARRLARMNSTGVMVNVSTAPVLQCVTQGAGGTTVNGVSNPTAAVRPLVIQIDRGGTRTRVFTDQEKIVGTVGTYATAVLNLGSSGGNSADAQYLYCVLLTAASAELSEAQVKSFLQALDWTIPWS